jgi:hypothetical protein
MSNAFAHEAEDRLHALDDRLVVPANHDGELRAHSTRHGARNRRIEHRDALDLQLRTERARTDRVRRAHVDEHGAAFQVPGKTSVVLHHAADHVAIRQHRDDELRIAEVRRCFGSTATVRAREACNPARVRVVHGHLVTALHEVARHRRAHVANTDEADAHGYHVIFSCARG